MSQNPTLIPISTSQRTLTMIKLVNLNYKPYDQKTEMQKNLKTMHRLGNIAQSVETEEIMSEHRMGNIAHTVDPVKIRNIINKNYSFSSSFITSYMYHSSFLEGITLTNSSSFFISHFHFNLSLSSSSKSFARAIGIVVLKELPVDFALVTVDSNSIFIPFSINFCTYKFTYYVIFLKVYKVIFKVSYYFFIIYLFCYRYIYIVVTSNR